MPTYTDSGLGWYAYEDWVRQSSGLLGRIPTGTPSVTCYDPSKGVEVNLGSIAVQGSPEILMEDVTIETSTNCFVVCGQVEINGILYASVLPMAKTPGTYYCRYRYNGTRHGGGSMSLDAETYGGYTVATYYQYWHDHREWRNAATAICDPIPADGDADTIAFAAFVASQGEFQDTTFYKYIPGYCVACIAEWGVRGESGSYVGPVLISTASQNVAISVNTESEPYSGHVWYLDLPAPGDRVYFQAVRDFSVASYTAPLELEVPYIDLGFEPLTDTQIANRLLKACGWHWGQLNNDDPYSGGGESEPEGGDGTFDFQSIDIPYGDSPTIGAFATGMVDIYIPTKAELVSLSQYLWSGAFDPSNFKKIVADPMDVIIGMQIVPLTAAQIGTTPGTLVVGNISTGISMAKATAQYIELDMGVVDIIPKWGSYLDFSPYSKLSLYLPYIGYVDINPDDCMNGSIGVKYYIDIIGGTCVAQVKCNQHVLYQFSGTCSCQVPVTAGQYQNIAIAAMNVIGSIAGAAGSVVPNGGGNAASVLNGVTSAINVVNNIANEAISMMKPAVQRSGGFGASSGLMGIQYPYLILTVPRMCIPGDQNKYIGYPSFVTKQLSTLSGFNSVQVTHLNNMSCTDDEANEIIQLLSEGVIF